jgi:hypothetical protein
MISPEANSAIPTIRSIQATNLALVAVSAGVLGYFVSSAAAVGCLVGGVLVVVNMFLLAALGRFALAAAERSGGVTRLGMAALPLKLLLFVALVYAVFARVHLDGLGFALGVLTQVTAIIIQTGRVAMGRSSL